MNNRMERARDFGTALLRVGLGAYYLMHGYFAGAVIGVQALAQANATTYSVPLPEVSAWFIVGAHFIGGAMLLIGLYPRVGALLNVPVMAGAVFFVHLKQGFFMSRAGGYEYALFLLIATVAVVFIGGGMFTLGTARKGIRISLD